MQVSWWLPLGEYWPRLLITAGLIGVVSLLEAISIAKALAEVNGDHVNADQELLGGSLISLKELISQTCNSVSDGVSLTKAPLMNWDQVIADKGILI